MLGRVLTSVFWGIVADRYGRKPVIIIGTISVLVNAILEMSFYIILLQLLGMDVFRQTFDMCTLLSQGCFQYSLWTQCKFLDGHHYKISSWKFKWFAWTNKGITLYYILLLTMWLQTRLYAWGYFPYLIYLPDQAYASEVFREEHQALGMSTVSHVGFFLYTSFKIVQLLHES